MDNEQQRDPIRYGRVKVIFNKEKTAVKPVIAYRDATTARWSETSWADRDACLMMSQALELAAKELDDARRSKTKAATIQGALHNGLTPDVQVDDSASS